VKYTLAGHHSTVVERWLSRQANVLQELIAEAEQRLAIGRGNYSQKTFMDLVVLHTSKFQTGRGLHIPHNEYSNEDANV